MLENMPGKLDGDLPQLLVILVDELNHQKNRRELPMAFLSMLYQALSMAFAYNSVLVFEWLDNFGLVSAMLLSWF